MLCTCAEMAKKGDGGKWDKQNYSIGAICETKNITFQQVKYVLI
jgi:hypothetical protein